MIGTDKVQPIGRTIPHIGRVGIVIGEPLDFSRYEGMQDDRFVLRSITDEIMYALMELSGQEYVDVYAATMKERLAAAKRAKPNPVAAAASAVTARVGERVGVRDKDDKDTARDTDTAAAEDVDREAIEEAVAEAGTAAVHGPEAHPTALTEVEPARGDGGAAGAA